MSGRVTIYPVRILIEMLREPCGVENCGHCEIKRQAANEIERLQTDNRELMTQGAMWEGKAIAAEEKFDETAQDSGRHLALLIQERQRTEQLTREREEALKSRDLARTAVANAINRSNTIARERDEARAVIENHIRSCHCDGDGKINQADYAALLAGIEKSIDAYRDQAAVARAEVERLQLAIDVEFS